MKTFQEKIEALRKAHAKSHPDSRAQIRSWENQMAELQVKKDWVDHPNTKAMKDLTLEQINRINGVLANDQKLEEAERKALFAEKNAHMSYLAFLSDDPASEMQSIEHAVNHEL